MTHGSGRAQDFFDGELMAELIRSETRSTLSRTRYQTASSQSALPDGRASK
jgi:hypothetical protein